MTREELLQAVKQTVLDFDPEAEVYLYGSRARGDARADSDWDFLVVLSRPVTWDAKDALRIRLYEIEWETGEVISAMVYDHAHWSSPPHNATPFHESVAGEGVRL